MSTQYNSSGHVLVLDCDSEEAYVAACRYLYLCKIGYCPIMSSPNHYWIVTDVVGSISDINNIARHIPGVDKLHVVYNDSRYYISIRAYPKKVTIDGLCITCVPTFSSDNHSLTNQLSIEWLQKFKEYWNSDKISTAIEIIKLREAYANKTINKLAMDPTFVI